MLHTSTCVYHFKVQFPLKMDCEYAEAKCKLMHNFSKNTLWKYGVSNAPVSNIKILHN